MFFFSFSFPRKHFSISLLILSFISFIYLLFKKFDFTFFCSFSFARIKIATNSKRLLSILPNKNCTIFLLQNYVPSVLLYEIFDFVFFNEFFKHRSFNYFVKNINFVSLNWMMRCVDCFPN